MTGTSEVVPATKAEALYNAFTFGWAIVELSSRIKIALVAPASSGLMLASVWRATFNRIASLQNEVFPKSTTENTFYEPPGKEGLPYLYPPAPDYANIGIAGSDPTGAPLLANFHLFEVTRRAINCLTLLYVRPEDSLIPDVMQENQDHLVAAILAATQDPGAGGGVAEPTGVPSKPEDALQKAKEALTERTTKFLEAWDGFLRENYYVGGMLPNDETELVAYEAGRAMSSLSWGVSVAAVPLEQKSEDARKAGTPPPSVEEFVQVWKTAFRLPNVILLQHQITALSSALDDVYYSRPNAPKRPEPDAVLVPLDPDQPSQAILAVKHSIDFWERTVEWISEPKNRRRMRPEILGQPAGAAPQEPDPILWSQPMRLALTHQSNIWQNLMTCQQSLCAYNMESITHHLMQDITTEIQQNMSADFSTGIKEAEAVLKETAQEAKVAIEELGQSAVNGMDALFKSFVHSFWPILGVLAVVFIVLVIVAISVPQNGTAAGASGGVGAAGILSAILGYFGLGKLTVQKQGQQTQVQKGKDTAKATVDSKVAAGIAGTTADVGNSNLLTRLEGVASETGAMVLKALDQGYRQMRIELDGLNRSAAVAYPLVEFFGFHFQLESEGAFLTEIIWSGTERADEIALVLRAAFGPLAVLIPPPGGAKANGAQITKVE